MKTNNITHTIFYGNNKETSNIAKLLGAINEGCRGIHHLGLLIDSVSEVNNKLFVSFTFDSKFTLFDTIFSALRESYKKTNMILLNESPEKNNYSLFFISEGKEAEKVLNVSLANNKQWVTETTNNFIENIQSDDQLFHAIKQIGISIDSYTIELPNGIIALNPILEEKEQEFWFQGEHQLLNVI